MVGMRQKLKDIELSPYMLAIYKDNEYHHLLNHALELWKIHTNNGRKPALRPFDTNPILYCRFPPLELIQEYDLGSTDFLGSRLLECPKVARWALERAIDIHENDREFLKIKLEAQHPYLTRVLMLIDYDEDLIYKIIYAGIAGLMPAAFQFKMTSDQKLAMTFCA